MKYILFIPLMYLQACAGFQGVADDVVQIANNDAITIKVDKDAINKDTNVDVEVRVTNTETNPVLPAKLY